MDIIMAQRTSLQEAISDVQMPSDSNCVNMSLTSSEENKFQAEKEKESMEVTRDDTVTKVTANKDRDDIDIKLRWGNNY